MYETLSPQWKQQTNILLVDDDASVRDVIARILLADGFEVNIAETGTDALRAVENHSFDLIISDIKMDGLPILNLIAAVSNISPNLPILMTTSFSDAGLIKEAMEAGALGFILCPFIPEALPVLVECYLQKHLVDLKHAAQRRKKIRLTHVQLLAAMIDAKEHQTAEHSKRVARLAKAVSQLLGLDEEMVNTTEVASLVHDIGKIATPDYILVKNGMLTEEEKKTIQQHPIKGAEIIRLVDEISSIADIVLYHHERIDGKGYPAGLKGEDIPFVSRIIAVADAYEVMTSGRIYQRVKTNAEAELELLKNSGTQFDEAVVNAFLLIPSEDRN